MDHIYQDIEFLTGEKGIMTHMLPNALEAMMPYLRSKVGDQRMWNGLYDPAHVGEIDIQPMNAEEKKDFWNRYGSM